MPYIASALHVGRDAELSTWTLEFTVGARLTGRAQSRSFLPIDGTEK